MVHLLVATLGRGLAPWRVIGAAWKIGEAMNYAELAQTAIPCIAICVVDYHEDTQKTGPKVLVGEFDPPWNPLDAEGVRAALDLWKAEGAMHASAVLLASPETIKRISLATLALRPATSN